VQESKTAQQTFWPSPQEYNEAVQNLHLNLKDQQLASGQIELSPLGIPRPITGSFASVYKVTADGQDWALRCFLRAVRDSEWRYKCISNFVQNDNLRCTVACDYQQQGIRISGKWFPILKMTWVDGETLDNYLAARLSRRQELVTVTNQFMGMCHHLKGAGIAHGDLQHGNIIVRDGGMYLVDYDGMYVPEMKGAKSNELGHRNYQHPKRDASHFGPYLDNFSAWVIFISLYATAIDPDLYRRLGAGADCLLFRQDDFLNPLKSCAFAALEQHSNEDVRLLARILRSQLQQSPDMVPALDAIGEIQPADLPSLEPNVPTERAHPTPTLIVSGSPDNSQMTDSAQQPWWVETQQTTRVPANRTTGAPGLQSEPELNQPIPRAVRFNDSLGKLSPMFFQGIAALPVMSIMGVASFVLSHAPGAYPIWMLCMIAAMTIEASIWWGPYSQQQLISHGSVSIGRITRKDFVSTYAGEGREGTYNRASYEQIHQGYFIVHYQFSFTDADGCSQSIQGHMKMDKEISEKFKVGQLATVIYDRGDPATSVIYKAALYQAV
jgi:hypothetical protein